VVGICFMVIKFVVRYGKRVWFWDDLWCGNSPLKDLVS
jgi:hypothetical protein